MALHEEFAQAVELLHNTVSDVEGKLSAVTHDHGVAASGGDPVPAAGTAHGNVLLALHDAIGRLASLKERIAI